MVSELYLNNYNYYIALGTSLSLGIQMKVSFNGVPLPKLGTTQRTYVSFNCVKDQPGRHVK